VAQRWRDEIWQRNAACRGPESVVFYPPTSNETRHQRETREARAKAICSKCPVLTSCLEYALDIMEPHGIWGGLTEQERRVLLERRAG
jgi:WhiB family redox-sensing transcriptional regulator